MIDIVERLRISALQVRMPPDCAESMLIAADEIEALRAEVAALRAELEKVNNEFGSQTADWPEAWRRVSDLKQLSNERWREAEALRADAMAYRSLCGKPC